MSKTPKADLSNVAFEIKEDSWTRSTWPLSWELGFVPMAEALASERPCRCFRCFRNGPSRFCAK